MLKNNRYVCMCVYVYIKYYTLPNLRNPMTKKSEGEQN